MSSYGDGSSARGRAQVGRAQVPGSVSPAPAGGQPEQPRGFTGPAGSTGRHGRPDDRDGGGAAAAAPRGAAPTGRASVGRATVSGSPGYQYDDEPAPARGRGRAAVSGAGAGSVAPGRASVGRAGVGRAGVPTSPAGPGGPYGPGGPAGPGGVGPGGPAVPPGRRRLDPLAAKRRKKARNRNLIIAAFAVFIMLAGAGVVGGTYYYDSVPPPQALDLPEATSIFFADGRTPLAKLGEEDGGNREYVPINGVPKHVQDAVISAEDRNFYQHDGIDFKGIIRAAWNNLTGGELEGASTITQQYARAAANLTGITYARKVREAVIASKLNQEYTKPKILEFYLNTIYLGRGAYGIQAASRAYFNKTVDKLTVGEAAVLAALIKQPEASSTHKGYDPAVNPQAAQERWGYVIDGMVEMGTVPAAERAKIAYPKLPKKLDACLTSASCGANKPVGNVINYVRQELEAAGITDLKAGGYRITTSINPRMQRAAENATRRVKGSPMNGQPKNLMAALVAVDPENGRVLAYYGGENGTGFDYAGTNVDPQTGDIRGGPSPGSTFKVYTLAAALREDISIESRWDALKTTDPERGPNFRISNANREGPQIACGHWCTLEESTVESYNVPFYWITKEIGPAKVVEAARDAGVRTMWTNERQAIDLTKISGGDEVAPEKFDVQVGFGQYGVTVLDHANGMATFANGGVYQKAHFVVRVEKKDATGKFRTVYGPKEAGQRKFDQAKIDDLMSVLQKIPENNNDDLAGDRPAAGKTGTWELDSESGENGDAWMAGATPQVAAAVWIGNVGNRQKIRDKNGVKIGGSKLPADVWKQFMDNVHRGLDVETFPPAARTGDPNRGNGIEPALAPNPGGPNQPCPPLPPQFCPPTNGNEDERRDRRDNEATNDNPFDTTNASPTAPPPTGGG